MGVMAHLPGTPSYVSKRPPVDARLPFVRNDMNHRWVSLSGAIWVWVKIKPQKTTCLSQGFHLPGQAVLGIPICDHSHIGIWRPTTWDAVQPEDLGGAEIQRRGGGGGPIAADGAG